MLWYKWFDKIIYILIRLEAFDFLDHELFIAKLNEYGFSLLALSLIRDYFKDNSKNQNRKLI